MPQLGDVLKRNGRNVSLGTILYFICIYNVNIYIYVYIQCKYIYTNIHIYVYINFKVGHIFTYLSAFVSKQAERVSC